MLPDLTAFMISSSCGIRVLPKNCISSAPFDCAVTSFAIQSNATAADSGTALMCANTSFFGWVCAKAGARPVARMPAMPAPLASRARRVNVMRVMGFLRGLGCRFASIRGLGAAILEGQDTEWPTPYQ